MNVLLPDQHLWNKLLEGDTIAFGEIYRRYSTELISYGYRMTSNRQLIKDSVHDLFLHLWVHRANLSPTDSIKFYLFRALRNRIIRNLQNPESTFSEYELPIDGILSETSWEHELIEQETQKGHLAQLKLAISKLPKRQQEAIQLRYFHAFELEDIASVMQLNYQSVRNLLHRAISQLRAHLEIVGVLLIALFKTFL